MHESVLLTESINYLNLNDIIHGVLNENAWVKNITNDLGKLILYRYAIIKTLHHIGKENIAIFIDKVDQAVAQTKAEREDPCQDCDDFNKFSSSCKFKISSLVNDLFSFHFIN